MNVYLSTGLTWLEPPGPVTRTSTVEAADAGAIAVIWFGESTLKLDAGVEPKVTLVAPSRYLPAIFTALPPAVLPDVGRGRRQPAPARLRR